MTRTPRTPITKQLHAVRLALSVLDRTLKKLSLGLGKIATGPQGMGGKPARRPLKLTAKRRAMLRLQGQYMGLVRQLKPKEKALVKALKGKKGFEAAIKKAQSLIDK